MTAKKTYTLAEDELPTEIIVSSHWAEARMAKGLLSLTPKQIKKLERNATISLPADLVETVSGPLKQKTPVEWIDPIEAVHWLSHRIGGDAPAKSAIAERLRDGAIECSIVWMSQGPDVGPVSYGRPRFPVLGSKANLTSWVTRIHRASAPLMLGGGFLGCSDDWDADQKRWDWQNGVILFSYQPVSTIWIDGVLTEVTKTKFRCRIVVSGIRFNNKDVKRIVESETPILAEVAGRNAKRGRSGPRMKKFSDGPYFARLEWEILSGEISRLGKVSDFGVQAKLEREITLELTEYDGLEPSESTVRRHAKKLMEMWKQHLLIEPQ